MSEDKKKYSDRTPSAEKFNASTNPRKSEPNKFSSQRIGPSGGLEVDYCSADGNSARYDYYTKIDPTGSIGTKDYEPEPWNSLSVKSEAGGLRTQQQTCCNTTDKNSDDNTLRCRKETVGGQKGGEVREELFLARGGNAYNLYGGSTSSATITSSKNNRNEITSGNINKKHTGSESISVEGDYFHSTGESRYDVVKNGEYAIHVQNGTLDVLSKKTVRITGDERVILTCGSSYILLLPNRIEIVADRVDINPSAKTIDVENLSGVT